MMATVRKSIEDVIDDVGDTPVQKWTGVIAAYDREFTKWEKRSKEILKRYRDERSERDGTAKFNILWSNVNTLVPAVYARIPKPDVSRRYRDNDPAGRVAALLLERAEEYETEHYPDFHTTMRQCVMDRFLGGRGTAWIRYEPHIRAVAKQEPEDGAQISEDVDRPDEELDYECAPVDYVHWNDFGHTVARTWEEVTAVWRKVYLTKEKVIERFGEEKAAKIPMDARPDTSRKNRNAGGEGEGLDRAEVYEIWDKTSMKAYWMSKSLPEMLDERDDPLRLERFFPCPKPLYSTMTNDTLIPIPDFTIYQDQANELNTLSDRIAGLIQALQVKGVYDDAIPALARIFTEGENTNLIPVKNWAAFAEKNGLAGAIDLVDLKPIYEALKNAYVAMQQLMQQIYDLTGISDIIRGQSEAQETATAQRIKGQYASLRLKGLQKDVARFASELLQLKAQVICSQFAPETILTISGAEQLADVDKALIPEALALLIGEQRMVDPDAQAPNPMRGFRIEVNSDTMVEMDEEEEKNKRIEFIAAQGAFMEKALPMAQASPQVLPVIAALWKFSVGAFKIGKTIEGEFDVMIDKAKQAAAQPQQPKPDPEMERVKADAAMQQQRAQADAQATQAKMQADMAIQQQKMQTETQLKQMEMQMELRLKQQEMSFMQLFEKWKAELEAQTKIKVAEINAENQPELARPQ